MEDNKDVVGATETAQVEAETTEKTPVDTQKTDAPKEKTFSRNEVNRMLNAEREKLKAELKQTYEAEKTEAEKLAKLDATERLNYELEQENKKTAELTNTINMMTLKDTAISYATEKKLPVGYIEDWDFAKETAETIKEKVDKLVQLRSKDLEDYLKDKLKQTPPKAVDDKSKKNDPYLMGFDNYMQSMKKRK